MGAVKRMTTKIMSREKSTFKIYYLVALCVCYLLSMCLSNYIEQTRDPVSCKMQQNNERTNDVYEWMNEWMSKQMPSKNQMHFNWVTEQSWCAPSMRIVDLAKEF